MVKNFYGVEKEAEAVPGGVHDHSERPTKEDGEKFMAMKREEEGVFWFPSGVGYKVIKEGKGPFHPSDSCIAFMHYHASLVDGWVYGSTETVKKMPWHMNMYKLIPGWREALRHMVQGDRWEIYVPPELGFGKRGKRGVPPDNTLVIETELLEVHGHHRTPSIHNPKYQQWVEKQQIAMGRGMEL
jgi:FKBP-type peptidyl-prolyl cis-trans isomerase